MENELELANQKCHNVGQLQTAVAIIKLRWSTLKTTSHLFHLAMLLSKLCVYDKNLLN